MSFAREGCLRQRGLIRVCCCTLVGGCLVLSSCSSSDGAEGVDETEEVGAEESGEDSDRGSTPEEIHQLQEDTIQACMAAEGFDYEPPPFDDLEAGRTWPDELRVERADEYGYPAVKFLVLSQLGIGSYDPVPTDLDLSEQEAYREALEGPIIWADSAEDDGSFSGGCRGEGYDAVRTQLDSQDSTAWQTLIFQPERYDEMIERVRATPGFTAFRDSWRLCLEEQGYTRDDPFNWVPEVFEYYTPFVEEHVPGPDADQALVQYFESTQDDLPDVEWREGVRSIDPDLHALLEDELQHATADHECREEYYSLIEDDANQVLEDLGMVIEEEP